MTYVLVKLSANYADEFDVEGFMVMAADAWEEVKQDTKQVFDGCGSYEWYFGTNEYITFDSYEHWLRCLDETEITEDEFKTIIKLFGDPDDQVAYFGGWVDID